MKISNKRLLKIIDMTTMKLIAECDTWNVAKIIRHQEQNEKFEYVGVFEQNPVTKKYVFKAII